MEPPPVRRLSLLSLSRVSEVPCTPKPQLPFLTAWSSLVFPHPPSTTRSLLCSKTTGKPSATQPKGRSSQLGREPCHLPAQP